MKKTIQHQFFFSHAPEMVWEYLTNPDLMALWLMKTNFKPIVGREFQFMTGPIPVLDFDGIFYCKVLEIEVCNKLVYSWKSGPGGSKITLDSIVEWTLQPAKDGTQVTLIHSGFEKEENLNFFNGLDQGWVKKLQKIDNLLKKEHHGSTRS